ncbi:sulfotransferase [Actinomadura sp. 9N215]|uniref:sulfotransferase n=1 Tax=Actinomadura sp. 9N215 TaxID=3375150 RepID=UPI0037A22A9F
MSPTFVVSTGRCGSTLLSHLLNLHPEVLSASEFLNVVTEGGRSDGFPAAGMDGRELWRRASSSHPDVDGYVLAGMRAGEMIYPYETGRFRAETGIPLICHCLLPMLTDDPDALFDRLAAEVPGWPRRAAADQYRALLDHLAGLLGRRVVVERSGGSLSLIPQLAERYPEARFVHMHRDGADTALSMSRHPATRHALLTQRAAATAGLPRSASWEQIRAAAPPEFDGLLTAPYDGERFMAYPIPLPFFAWMWNAMVKAGTEALERLPARRWTGLAYERLVADPDAELTRLAGFVGVSAPPSWLDAARALIDRSRTGSAAAKLAPDALAALRAACEPGARAIEALESAHPGAGVPARP